MKIICGVDVSASHLDARVGMTGAFARFDRTATGIGELGDFCRRHGVDLVVFEATGGYEKLPFCLLWQQGLACALVNPRAVRDLAKGLGYLEKTDRLDAGIIARFAEITLARRFESGRTELHRLRALADTTALITSTLEPSDVLNRVLDTVIMLTGAERAYVVLRDRDTGALEFAAARGIDREALAAEDAAAESLSADPNAARRADLMALYAFNIEVASVRERVSEPLPGEVRLQWWRDVLTGEGRGDIAAHPVAAAMRDVVARHRLSVQPLVALIDARVFDLYDDPMPTLGDFEGYCGETSSALMQIAALILAEGRDPGTADLAGHAGIAYAATGLLRAFGLHARRGQLYMPLDVLAAQGVTRDEAVSGRDGPGIRAALSAMRDLARRHLATAEQLAVPADPATAAAFAPLATVAPRLARLGTAADPFAPPREVPQWRLQWTMWRWVRRFGRTAGR